MLCCSLGTRYACTFAPARPSRLCYASATCPTLSTPILTPSHTFLTLRYLNGLAVQTVERISAS